MIAPIRVTVEEPITREITLEQVREYMSCKKWREHVTPPERLGLGPAVSIALWKCPGHAGPFDPAVSIIRPLDGQTDEEIVRAAIYTIAAHEGRSPAAVLREIAGEAEGRSTRAELQLLAAVDEARAALGHFASKPRGTVLDRAEAALSAVRQQRERTPVEQRADEIEAHPDLASMRIDEVIEQARVLFAEGRREPAAAWILVAQRMLAQEVDR